MYIYFFLILFSAMNIKIFSQHWKFYLKTDMRHRESWCVFLFFVCEAKVNFESQVEQRYPFVLVVYLSLLETRLSVRAVRTVKPPSPAPPRLPRRSPCLVCVSV